MELLEPVQIGNYSLQSKVVMAPMTRGFANDLGIIHPDTINYYKIRAFYGVGMIITEGISISKEAQGTVGIPGLYTLRQVEAWKDVTKEVHKAGGLIIAQLWHVGRLSHSYFTGGTKPIAPSAVQANGQTHNIRMPYETPRPMTITDIERTIADFAAAAENAMNAGFDGVEIHAAHGYLIDQFQSYITNLRKDEYGQKKFLFLEQIIKAVGNSIGIDKVIVRFSEHKDDLPLYYWENPEDTVQEILNVFYKTGISLIHPSSPSFKKPLTNHTLTLHALIRKYWNKASIGVGEMTPNIAEEAISSSEIQLAAFARPLLANPDMVELLKRSTPLKKYHPETHLSTLLP
ncbi:oxidoreductase [Salipaludibacillus neizhouensis]|uniref:oxidoreductase n=1 Tax=Salipaludibacillus neizhouensis TaxID=885475 RepID=UPI001CBA64AA|nr:alkene reductase [Salipaludibacillus neizhouensis]